MPPIGLITDFGARDYYTAAMKGMILSINPDAGIVDISHQIPKHGIKNAAFVLCHGAETFPKDSIFIAVIDPGVGTERKCILLRTNNGFNFIGPDNGVFTLVAERFGVEEVREISNQELMRSEVSSTFHGRDIMAPVGAHLSLGTGPSQVGPPIEDFKTFELEKPRLKDDAVYGQIVNIDNFGNVVTNIGTDLIEELVQRGRLFKVQINEKKFQAPFGKAFEDVSKGEELCYIGSANTLEIAKNQESLADELNLDGGEKLNITANS